MYALASLLALAAPSPHQGFVFTIELDVVGTVSGVTSQLAAPLDAVVAGDLVVLHLEFLASDAPCTTPSGLTGFDITSAGCVLDVGQASVGFDPATTSCFLGVDFMSGVGSTRTEMAADMAAGLGSAELELLDPNGTTNISVFEILSDPLIVANVTDPAFSSSFELLDPMGSLGVTIDLEMISGLRFLNSICPVVPNSTGQPARLFSRGTTNITDNNLVLGATDLPANSFAMFVTSQTTGFVQNPGSSAGNLCLGGSIGRFRGPGQILPTGTGGPIELPIDLTALPLPTSTVAAQPGEIWYFSLWYRDVTATTTSNFSGTTSLIFF